MVLEYLLDCGAAFQQNKDKLTFIDLAIKQNQKSVLMKLISHSRWEEAMDSESVEHKTPFIGIIKMSSEVCKAVMDRCVTRELYEESKKYTVSMKEILN